MQTHNLNVARLLRLVERVVRQWAGYGAARPRERSASEGATSRICPLCGQIWRPSLPEANQLCDPCANQVSPVIGEVPRTPLFSWGDFIAAAAIAVLAYILAGMYWSTFHHF